MAIVIVDDENNTREALRSLLQSMGHKTILEARDGQEGLKILEAEKTRVRMVIADWEMPYMDGLSLLKEIATRAYLDLAPFLLITSDLPKMRIEAFQRENPRLDSHLIKPFRMKTLAEGMARAHAVRWSAHDTIVYAGSTHLSKIEQAIKDGNCGHWRVVVAADSLAALEKAVGEHARRIGAIFVEPESYANWKGSGGDWLSSYRKTPEGGATVTVCVGRDPKAVLPVRTQCQFFMDTHMDPKGDPLGSAREMLQTISTHVLKSWEVELLGAQAKQALQQKKFDQCRKLAEQMLGLDPHHSDALGILTDSLLELKDIRGAIDACRRSIGVNPCMPRAHIRLMDLLSRPEAKGSMAEQKTAAELAVAYCPNSQDVTRFAEKLLGTKTST